MPSATGRARIPGSYRPQQAPTDSKLPRDDASAEPEAARDSTLTLPAGSFSPVWRRERIERPDAPVKP
ncbi:MAG TPA: hypothetical protein VNY05_19605 [Candidatus Acidoferrales bacterium]|nr:hypothetical protein [Candidatus Acidoferrales bacterium]